MMKKMNKECLRDQNAVHSNIRVLAMTLFSYGERVTDVRRLHSFIRHIHHFQVAGFNDGSRWIFGAACLSRLIHSIVMLDRIRFCFYHGMKHHHQETSILDFRFHQTYTRFS